MGRVCFTAREGRAGVSVCAPIGSLRKKSAVPARSPAPGSARLPRAIPAAARGAATSRLFSTAGEDQESGALCVLGLMHIS